MEGLTRRRPDDRVWLAVGLVVGLVGLALVRVTMGGPSPLAPDDARYLFVGRSILEGDGPVGPSGSIFLLRSPVYGLVLALGGVLLGGDPLVGARVVALTLALLGMAGALRLGWLLAGPGGATGTAIGLIALPLIWRLVPSLRIDLPQTCAIVAVLLAAWRPTTLRWALAGVLLGVAILVKETALPLLFLPVALIGSLPPSRVARLAAVFVGAAVLTAAWWWIVVWVSSGQLFPLGALSVVEARDAAIPLRVGRTALPLLGAIAAGWGLVGWRARRDPGARLLVVAGVGLLPAALYAASLGLDARNFAGLAVLSAVAVGAGGAWAVADLRTRRLPPAGADLMAGSTRSAPAGAARDADTTEAPTAEHDTAMSGAGDRPSRPTTATRAIAALALAGIAIVAIASPVLGQRDVAPVAPDRLTDGITAWLEANAPDGTRIAMAFRERDEIALRRFGRSDVALLPLEPVDPVAPPETYLWMGLRDGQLFGYRRAAWIETMTRPAAADLLVLVAPHPFTPVELTGDPATARQLGLVRAALLEADGGRAEIDRIDPNGILAGARDVPLHLSAAAADAWLDLAGPEHNVDRFLAARPVVHGEAGALRTLTERLGAAACQQPTEDQAVRFGTAGSCAD